MPAQPAWFHRLDEILSGLRSMTFTHLDRGRSRNCSGCASAPQAADTISWVTESSKYQGAIILAGILAGENNCNNSSVC